MENKDVYVLMNENCELRKRIKQQNKIIEEILNKIKEMKKTIEKGKD